MSKGSKRKKTDDTDNSSDVDRDLGIDFDSDASSTTQDNESWTVLSESDYNIPTTINNYNDLKVWFHETIGEKDRYLRFHKKKEDFVYDLLVIDGYLRQNQCMQIFTFMVKKQ